jgi:hypothetical protein
MNEFLASDAAKNNAEDETKFYPLRQRDISLGAGLMAIAVLKAFLLAANIPGGRQWLTFFFTLGMIFSAGLLLSQLSPRQRGLTVGATILFLGAMLGVLAGFATSGFGAPLAVLGLFLGVSFCWMPLMRLLRRIFFDKEETSKKPRPVPLEPIFFNVANAPLPPAQTPAAADLDTRQMKQAEKIERFSVVEDSTRLLKNE